MVQLDTVGNHEKAGSGENTARTILSRCALDPNDSSAAPTTAIGRYAEVTVKGLAEVPMGIGTSIVDDISHPVHTLETAGRYAVFGAGLNMVLPEGLGKIGALLVTGYYLSKAASPVFNAYGRANRATTIGDLNSAANDLGMAGGAFLLNSSLAMVSYRLGGELGGRIMGSQPMTGFAESKARFWNGCSHPVTSVLIVRGD